MKERSASILELGGRSDLQDLAEQLDIGLKVEKDSKVSSLRNKADDGAS